MCTSNPAVPITYDHGTRLGARFLFLLARRNDPLGHVYRYYLRIGDPNDLQEETVALYFENDSHIREGELLRSKY